MFKALFTNIILVFDFDDHIQQNILYVMYFLQGLKRSVTTLRGGTLGYAEIVAVKVRPAFSQKDYDL